VQTLLNVAVAVLPLQESSRHLTASAQDAGGEVHSMLAIPVTRAPIIRHPSHRRVWGLF